MKTTEKYPAVHEDTKTWRGYTITELEHRRAINAVKCDLIKEQMSLAYGNAVNAFAGESASLGPRFNRVLSYVSYGVQLARYARSFYSILKGK